MSDLAVSVLSGASLVLEAVGAEEQVDVNVTEVRLSIEVCASEPALVIVSEPPKVDLIEVLLPGGGGAPAPVAYERRVDVVAEDVAYRAEALPGAADDAPVWRIRRITIDAAGDPVIAWAGGSPDFAHAWPDRLTLNYSLPT